MSEEKLSKRKSLIDGQETKRLSRKENETVEVDDEYQRFLKLHGGKWRGYNFVSMIFFIGLAVGTYYMIKSPEEDCANLKQTLYLVMLCHIANAFLCGIIMMGQEINTCTTFSMTIFTAFELTMLIYS